MHMPRFIASFAVAASVVSGASRISAPPERVQLTIATLHAAALTTSRAAEDSLDAPFFVVSVIGRDSGAPTVLPENGPLTIRRDQALGARPLTELSLAPGDTVQVLVSVLENTTTKDISVANASKASGQPSRSIGVERVTQLLAPFIDRGANWLGSASLLVTNEGGSIYWRRLECIAACKVLAQPGAAPLVASAAQPSAGTVELSGKGGTYHLALQAKHAP